MNDNSGNNSSDGFREKKVKRRKLLDSYRSLSKAVDEGLMDDDAALEKVDELASKLETGREAEEDAKFLNTIATKYRGITSKSACTFNVVEYTGFLASRFRTSDDISGYLDICDWIRIGECAFTAIRRSPSFHYLLGAFNNDSKTKAVTSSSERKVETRRKCAIVTPTVLSNRRHRSSKKTNTEHGTDVQIKHVHECLVKEFNRNKREPLGYFEFVVNPSSFTLTVRNMFHLAFLIKESKATLIIDEEGDPYITLLDVTNSNDDNLDISQLIVSLNMGLWRRICNAFKIKRSMVTTDNEVVTLKSR